MACSFAPRTQNENDMEITNAWATIFSLALGAGVKHFAPMIPNGWIPLMAVLGPSVLGYGANLLTGLDLGSPVANAALGGLAVAIHSTGKHYLEGKKSPSSNPAR